MTADASDDIHTYQTPPSWAVALVGSVDELLLEQAHLEKKAAAAAVAFLFRLPLDARLHRQLSVLAREELGHFERALKLMRGRGVDFAAQTSSGYAEKMKQAIRKDFSERLVDELLVAAIIERRSHERMSLLADALSGVEPVVSRFYRDLCPAEERHEDLYVELATLVSNGQDVQSRYQELADHEARVLDGLPFAPRLHGGLPGSADA